MVEGKFGGVGLGNIFVIWLICMVFTCAAKMIAGRYNVPGVSEFIMACS